jgi:SAM-dependent methyltransferase
MGSFALRAPVCAEGDTMKVFGKEYSWAYDCLYKDKDYIKECDFIESIFRRYRLKVRRVLDLGCGTGGHALILAKRGYEVVGVDRSGEMLNIARSKAKKAKLPLKFIQGDITKLNLGEKFDAVISMFAVIGYQTTDENILKSFCVANKHLFPGGIFLFDCWHGKAVLSQKPVACLRDVRLDGKRTIRFTNSSMQAERNMVKVEFKVLNFTKNQLIGESHEVHLIRFLFLNEIRSFLKKSKFGKPCFYPFLKLGKKLTKDDWNMTVAALSGGGK